MKNCSQPRCNAPDVTCRMGEDSLQDCQFWRSGTGQAARTAAQADVDLRLTRLPWSGAALGTTDLPFLTGRGEPKLVALIGPHNAGKTTLLGMFYQQVGRGRRIGEAGFAGSYSLEGWEAIAHALRWEGNAPRFPPHTSSGSGRAPGLLHLAMRAVDGKLSDVLFADSPGEWFRRWAIEPTAGDAEGARWLVERASALLLIADCEALAGPKRGEARNDVIQLVRRIAASRQDRPVALVWTKADIAVPLPLREAVTKAAKLVMPDILEFETSVVPFEREGVAIQPAEAVTSVFAWTTARVPRGFALPVPATESTDPFFAIGISQ